MPKIIGSHIPTQIKNLVVNGALDFWQEKESTTSTVNTATTVVAYSADMIKYESGGSTTKNYSLVRSTDVPSFAQAGFNSTYSCLFTMVTAITSPAANDFVIPFEYLMEGNDYVKVHGKAVTIGFWVKASIAGTYGLTLTNSAFNRSYVTTFTITGASTWEFKTFTITLDNTGTWNFDNTTGLRIYIGVITGSSFQSGTLNAWQGAGVLAPTGITNYQATAGATLRVALFSIVEGPLGFGATGFARSGDTIQEELGMCQRYYEKSYNSGVIPGSASQEGSSTQARWGTSPGSSDEIYAYMFFKSTKRTAPTITFFNPATGTANQFSIDGGGSLSAKLWASGSNADRIATTNNAPSSTSVHRIHMVADARM